MKITANFQFNRVGLYNLVPLAESICICLSAHVLFPGFKFMGLQKGSQCFCGNKFGKKPKKPEVECGMKCQGNDEQICGGNLRNSIYTTRLEHSDKGGVLRFKN